MTDDEVFILNNIAIHATLKCLTINPALHVYGFIVSIGLANLYLVRVDCKNYNCPASKQDMIMIISVGLNMDFHLYMTIIDISIYVSIMQAKGTN